VNAHLNVLDPDKSLPQIYSAFISPSELKKVVMSSNNLLRQSISNARDFTNWVQEVHDLLSEISTGEQSDEGNDELPEGVGKKGLISRKAISTYLKQWELFVKEKLGPNFSLVITEDDASPLSGRLNELEDGASRTWTTMLDDITEARSSAIFQKRAAAVTERSSTSSALKNIDSFDLKLSGRQLKIQMTAQVSKDVIAQFSKAMKAQFIAYSGNGLFEVSLQSGQSVITVSVANPTKPELKKIEDMLLELI
jgi:hypothetical protein